MSERGNSYDIPSSERGNSYDIPSSERGRISYVHTTTIPSGMRPRPSRSRPRKDKKLRKFWSSFKNWVKEKTIKNTVVSPSEIEIARKQFYEEIHGVNPLEWTEEVPDTFTSPVPADVETHRQQGTINLKNSLNRIERDCKQQPKAPRNYYSRLSL
jgi:hypothetical protein